jgi:ribose 5-phosphate isomerase B
MSDEDAERMSIVVGADHAGVAAKQVVVRVLEEISGDDTPGPVDIDVTDMGTDGDASVDYPDYAESVGRAVSEGEADRGVLLCGSGVGMAVAANKIEGVRACVCHDTYSARQAVEHDALNVLCLGGRVIGDATIGELVRAFVLAAFSGEQRHQRRLGKVEALEK